MISPFLRVIKVCKWPAKASQISLAESHFKAVNSENIISIRGEFEDVLLSLSIWTIFGGFMLDCTTAQKNGRETQRGDLQAF